MSNPYPFQVSNTLLQSTVLDSQGLPWAVYTDHNPERYSLVVRERDRLNEKYQPRCKVYRGRIMRLPRRPESDNSVIIRGADCTDEEWNMISTAAEKILNGEPS